MFTNCTVSIPKMIYNGPITVSESSEMLQSQNVEPREEHPELTKYSIFKKDTTLVTLYKLKIEGCYTPQFVKSFLDYVEYNQKLLRITCTNIKVSEKLDEKHLEESLKANSE